MNIDDLIKKLEELKIISDCENVKILRYSVGDDCFYKKDIVTISFDIENDSVILIPEYF